MNADEKKKLDHIVSELVRLNADKKSIAEQVKELIEAAYDDLGVSKTVVKQLAKERGWSDLERETQRMLEEELDQMRAALGMLGDTPLGQAAQDGMRKRTGRIKEAAGTA